MQTGDGDPAAAQSSAPHPSPRYEYCELIADGDLPRTGGVPIIIDRGQKQRTLQYDVLRDAEGRKLKFNSIVDAFNRMAREGWEFVQAYSTGESNDCVHYVLRRAIETPATKQSNRSEDR